MAIDLEKIGLEVTTANIKELEDLPGLTYFHDLSQEVESPLLPPLLPTLTCPGTAPPWPACTGKYLANYTSNV